MESARIQAMLDAALPPLFRCAPAPGGGVRIRTPFLYPDGDAIDLLATDDGGQCVLTDGGETLGWLWLNSVSGTLSAKQEYLLDMVCRCELGLPGYQGELTATAPGDRPEELAAAVFRLGLAIARVADLWFLEPHSAAGMGYNAADGKAAAAGTETEATAKEVAV